jgi:uncharacterized protein
MDEQLSVIGGPEAVVAAPEAVPEPAPEPVPETTPPAIAPVTRQERLSSVDAIRGFSLLGILLLNIVSFGQAHWAYGNPHPIGGSNPLNVGVWAVMWILADGKMRAIFSMLFGAGTILLTSRAEGRGGGLGIADIYTRRNMWLLLFGILHCYLFWLGDILYWYALTGLVFLYPMRKMSAKALLITGGIVMLLSTPRGYFESHSIIEARDKYNEAAAAEKAGKKLTKDQEEAKKNWENMQKDMNPDQKAIDEENQEVRGGFLANLKLHAKWAPRMESLFYYQGGFLDVLAMMLLGMGLLKLGYLSAARSYREYATVAVVGYLIGIPINCFTVYIDIRDKFDHATMALAGYTYDIERFAVALAHISVIMLLCKAGLMKWFTSRLAAVGQMALTNYLFDTIACCFFFCGYGLGMFGKLERYQLYYVVAAIWSIEFFGSKIWLSYFRFGPAEWLWRSLTYWKRQPMRLRQPAASVPVTAIAAEAS